MYMCVSFIFIGNCSCCIQIHNTKGRSLFGYSNQTSLVLAVWHSTYPNPHWFGTLCFRGKGAPGRAWVMRLLSVICPVSGVLFSKEHLTPFTLINNHRSLLNICYATKVCFLALESRGLFLLFICLQYVCMDPWELWPRIETVLTDWAFFNTGQQWYGTTKGHSWGNIDWSVLGSYLALEPTFTFPSLGRTIICDFSCMVWCNWPYKPHSCPFFFKLTVL